jgi:uncharacterized protein with PIN domain
MKIFVDEHIPLMTVRTLRMLGHDVRDIRGTADEGMQDDALWEMAQWEKRLLITTDKGFTQYRTVPHHGVLVSVNSFLDTFGPKIMRHRPRPRVAPVSPGQGLCSHAVQ